VLILSRKSTQRQIWQTTGASGRWSATASWIAVDDKLWQKLLADHRKAIRAKDFQRCGTMLHIDMHGECAISSKDRFLAYVRGSQPSNESGS